MPGSVPSVKERSMPRATSAWGFGSLMPPVSPQEWNVMRPAARIASTGPCPSTAARSSR